MSAARILDLAGIVCNRNTIPGDKSARSPSGIRLGTPWITQRGFQAEHVERLADIIARVLKAMQPHAYAGRRGPIYSATGRLRCAGSRPSGTWWTWPAAWTWPRITCPSGYPHHYFMHKPTTDPGGDWDLIQIVGPHARGFLNVAMTNDAYALGPGESQPTWILEPDGRLMSPGVLKRPGADPHDFQLLVPKAAEARVAHWLRALSDGFVSMDPDDEFVKAPGPVVVRRLPHEVGEAWPERPPTPEQFADDTRRLGARQAVLGGPLHALRRAGRPRTAAAVRVELRRPAPA